MPNGSRFRRIAVALFLSFELVGQALAATRQEPPGWQPPNVNAWTGARPSYVVMLVLDGGVPSYFKVGSFPHLAALARSGVVYSRAMDGILEAETPTGHASLGTGSLPRRHGIISFAWANDKGEVFHPTDPTPIQQGELERLLRASGVPSLASALKEKDRSARMVVTSGHKDYAVDSLGGWAADYLMFYGLQGQNWVPQAIPRHVPPQSVMTAPGLTAYAPHLAPGDQDSLAVHLALSAFRTLHQRVTVVNLPEFDWPLGHLNGGPADRNFAWQLMNRLDADVAAIRAEYDRAGVLGKTLFVLAADHGMVTLHHQVPYPAIEGAVRSAGTTLARYEFHTAGYLWLRDPKRARAVAESILKLNNPGVRAVYYRDPGSVSYMHASGGPALVSHADSAYRYLLDTMGGDTAPHVAVILRENTSILGQNQTNWQGDHGGPTWNSEHIPLILSGPGVRRGVMSSYPATLLDVAPTILSLLGASSAGMDGVVLADGLTRPGDGQVDAQTKRSAILQPIVDGLLAQSAADGQ